jgi:hypothetical protein
MVSPTENEDLKDQQTTEASSTSDTDQDIQDSSNPNPAEKAPSTFDVVMKALDKDGEDDAGGSSEEDKSKKADADKKAKDDKDEADDDFKDFTPEERAQMKKATTERFDKLKGLYRESKEKVTQITAQLEQANVEAGYYKKFVGFLDENRISQDEANQLFNIGALMKNDPVKALELITPYYNDLLHITGNVLPPDLQQQVKTGHITKERAFELSRLRATGQTYSAINEERTTHQQQRDTNRQRTEEVSNMQSAISDWEKNWSSSDPDYAKKKDRVLDRVELLLVRAQRNGTLPKNNDEAVKLANQAKSEIEADLKKMNPQRKQVRTVDGGSSASNLPDPKNTADVIRRTLNQ